MGGTPHRPRSQLRHLHDPGRREWTRRTRTPDELYVCTRGRATLWTPTGSCASRPAPSFSSPANEEHRFVDIEEDFTVLVVFGPAEYSRA